MDEIKKLLEITAKLRDKHHRGFSLDGKLVGDIGEVLTAQKYGLQLLPENNQIYDAFEPETGRLVQIKASFKYYCYFPAKHIPDYFLSINILPSGEIEELYNGSGKFLYENYVVKNKLKVHNSEYTLSKGILLNLNSMVPLDQKIKAK